jgi:hypothetical protein
MLVSDNHTTENYHGVHTGGVVLLYLVYSHHLEGLSWQTLPSAEMSAWG